MRGAWSATWYAGPAFTEASHRPHSMDAFMSSEVKEQCLAMPDRLDQFTPRTIVKITFQRDPDGEIDHLAPFQASGRGDRSSGIYDDEPHVIAEMEVNTRIAFFEAQLIDGRWRFGGRIPD